MVTRGTYETYTASAPHRMVRGFFIERNLPFAGRIEGKPRVGGKFQNLNSERLILGFRVLAEECAGCDHRTHVR